MDINTCLATTIDLRQLALYSHVGPVLAALLLGIFALWRAPDRDKAFAFFVFTFGFSAWLIFDLSNWLTNNYQFLAATWSPISFTEVVFFVALFLFFYKDLFKGGFPRWLQAVSLIIVGISFVVTVSGNAVGVFDQPQCNMVDNPILEAYKLTVEVIILTTTLLLGFTRAFFYPNSTNERIRISLITLSIVFFMGIFGGGEYISSTLANFSIMLYGLFSLPLFILLLTIAITNFGTFKLGDATILLLFLIFITISGSQFFFVSGTTDLILTTLAFIVTLGFGVLLYKGSKREIRLRHEVEQLATELEETNERQEILIRFISHEVKGYLTKDAAAFASLAEEDFCKLPDEGKSFVASALAQTRDGVESVLQILKASNQKKGTTDYKKESFDLAAAVKDTVQKEQMTAQQKKLALSLVLDESAGPYTLVGDKGELVDHVFKNLIENSLNYTPSGSIEVSLKKVGKNFVFAVKDTGVGITEEDKKRLFTEGGHGKDSQKVNVHSTGYGLFIAKNIVLAHNGTIRAESEGAGKGSTFVVELPA